MWLVDSVFSVINGDVFFNMSLNDTYLKIIIVIAALLVWSILFVIYKFKKRVQNQSQRRP